MVADGLLTMVADGLLTMVADGILRRHGPEIDHIRIVPI